MNISNIYIKNMIGELIYVDINKSMNIFDVKMILYNYNNEYHPFFQQLFIYDDNEGTHLFKNGERCREVLKNEEMICVVMTDKYIKDDECWKYMLHSFYKDVAKKNKGRIHIIFIYGYPYGVYDYPESLEKRYELQGMSYSFPNKKWYSYIYNVSERELFHIFEKNKLSRDYFEIDPIVKVLYDNMQTLYQ